MIYLAVIAVGFLLGIAVGRWWTLLVAVGFGIWVWAVTGVDEVPPWFLGVAFAGLGALAIAGGVALRRAARRS